VPLIVYSGRAEEERQPVKAERSFVNAGAVFWVELRPNPQLEK